MTQWKFYKTLNEEEEKEFRQWARDHYSVGDSIDPSWHPVVQDECMSMMVNILGIKESEDDGQTE